MKSVSIVIIFLLLAKCGEYRTGIQTNDEVVRFGDLSVGRDDFEKYCCLNRQSGISQDSLLHASLSAFYRKALMINHLQTVNHQLTEAEKLELDYRNRLDLVGLAIDSLLFDIDVDEQDVAREIEYYSAHQVVIDHIYLPVEDSELLDECVSFLNSGGNIVDLINYKKEIYRAICDNKGLAYRINVPPGMFIGELSEFIHEGKSGETRMISSSSGFHVIKILYKTEGPSEEPLKKDVIRNLRKAWHRENGFQRQMQNSYYCNDSILNSIDFSIRPLLGEIDTTVVASFRGKKIYVKNVQEHVTALPFDSKIYFNNAATKPSAIAVLILKNQLHQPFDSKSLLRELYQEAKEASDADIPVGVFENDPKLFEYKYLDVFEKSKVYPWLFPGLFKEIDALQINYEVAYAARLIESVPYLPTDTVVVCKEAALTAAGFKQILGSLTINSLSDLIRIENAKKLIYYYYEENYNVVPSKINIDTALLERIILDFSKGLAFHVFTNGLISDGDNIKRRLPHKPHTIVASLNGVEIDVVRLRQLVAQLPDAMQRSFRADNIKLNAYWRREMVNEIIEQEVWLAESHHTGLQHSDAYDRLKCRNEQDALIASFLNSIRADAPDAIDARLKAIVNNSLKLTIVFNEEYFARKFDRKQGFIFHYTAY
jgi:hypothetical protein